MEKKQKILVMESDPNEAQTIEKGFKDQFDVVIYPQNGKNPVSSLEKYHPDVVILDLKAADWGMEVIKNCRKQCGCDESLICIVTIPSELKKSWDFIRSMDVDYCMMKPFETGTLVHRIQQILRLRHTKQTLQPKHIKNTRRDTPVHPRYHIQQEATKIIRDLGIPAHIKGYQYLREGILLAVKDVNMMNYITKLLYPAIAKKYKTTSNSVERAIRHAIEVAWTRGKAELLEEMFGDTIRARKGKPTNSQFIATIADRLRGEYQKNVS